jgi:hypothetical protein
VIDLTELVIHFQDLVVETLIVEEIQTGMVTEEAEVEVTQGVIPQGTHLPGQSSLICDTIQNSRNSATTQNGETT